MRYEDDVFVADQFSGVGPHVTVEFAPQDGACGTIAIRMHGSTLGGDYFVDAVKVSFSRSGSALTLGTPTQEVAALVAAGLSGATMAIDTNGGALQVIYSGVDATTVYLATRLTFEGWTQ